MGRPYGDCRLAIELLHSAAPPLPGSREATEVPGSGLARRARRDQGPGRNPSCDACRPNSPTPPAPLLSATAAPLHAFLLHGVDGRSGKTAPGAACPRGNPLAGSGTAGDCLERGEEKTPGDGGSGGGAAARARARAGAGRGQSRLERGWSETGARLDLTPLAPSASLLGLQAGVASAGPLSGVQV